MPVTLERALEHPETEQWKHDEVTGQDYDEAFRKAEQTEPGWRLRSVRRI